MPFAEGEVCARITWLKMWTVEAPVLGVLAHVLRCFCMLMSVMVDVGRVHTVS